MKKYIILSLFIHIGIGAALISWSDISISEWTQNLFNSFSNEQALDDSIEIEGDLPKKTKKVKKIVTQKPKQKVPTITPPKPALKKTAEPTADHSSKNTIVENSNTENSSEEAIAENSNIESSSEEIVQTEDTPDVNQDIEPEVKYNPAEDLTAIQQENTVAPSNNPESAKEEEQEESLSESTDSDETETVSKTTSESEPVKEDSAEPVEPVANRDFEEINTDPQDLKNIIKESPSQAEVKSSQALVPAPGNPGWFYPQQAQKNNNEGSVFLQYFVDDIGFVDKIKLLKSSGYSLLDNEALRVMARQRYQPGQSGWYRHRVDFKLKNM